VTPSRRTAPAVSPYRTPLALLLAVLAAALPRPARAELVVLGDGEVLKVKAYAVDGDRARLTLPSGGRMTLALARIAHVVDDEVLPAPDPVPPAAAVAEAGIELLFEEGQALAADTPYAELIVEASRRHGVNPRLVAAVIRAESAFHPRAVSHKGARGLMQLMPATARRFGVGLEELFVPERNVEAGIRYLRWLVDRFPDDLPRVLAAYNAGETTVERYQGVPPYRETRDYIRRICKTLGLELPAVATL
jgi:soluble lytic murein transglycosylase-like protein